MRAVMSPAVTRRDPHGSVLAPGGQPPAVGTERRARDDRLVAPQDVALLAGCRVPDPHRPARPVVVGGGDEAVVGAEGDAPRRAPRPPELEQRLTGVRVPHGGGAVPAGGPAGDE